VSSDASTSIPRSSSLALATCYVAVIARRDRALLGRWALLALTGAGIATLAIRNNRLVASDSVIGVSLGVMSPLAVFGATGLGEAVLQAERHGRWLLDVSATSRAVRELGAVLAVAFYGSLAGFVHGAIVALSSVTRARVTLSALGGSVVLGAVCAMVPRWTSRARDRAGRALITRIVLGGVLSYLAAAFTEAGLLAGVGLTAGLCALVPPEPSGAALLAREEGE
jgi:hypothetical protein